MARDGGGGRVRAVSESKRPPLLRRLLRLSRPDEPHTPPPPARPETTSVVLQPVSGSVMLPRELRVIPVAPAWAEALTRASAQAPASGLWLAVLEEPVFQAALKNPASLPVMCTLAQFTRGGQLGSEKEAGIALRGMTRARVYTLVQEGERFRADVAVAEAPSLEAAKLEPLAAELRTLGKQLLRVRPAGPFYLSAATLDAMREPDGLADVLAAWCDPDAEARRRILDAVDVEARARLVIELLKGRIPSP